MPSQTIRLLFCKGSLQFPIVANATQSCNDSCVSSAEAGQIDRDEQFVRHRVGNVTLRISDVFEELPVDTRDDEQ